MEENAEKQEKMSEEKCEKPLNGLEKFSGNAKKLTIKLSVIIAALLVFQIPLYMIKDLTTERQQKAKDVHKEIYSKWGGVQQIKMVPAADKIDFNVELKPEIRYRGIYQAAVYTADVKVKAEFDNVGENQFAELIILGIDCLRDAQANVNGKSVNVEKTPVDLKMPLEKGKSVVEITFSLRGGDNFLIIPNSTESHIVISGAWGSPSFTGNQLPDTRTIEKDKFTAEWNFNKFSNRNIEVGVNFNLPANTYQQVERCFNYATLFLIIFFATLLFAEIITKVNIHILQYIVAAGAPVLFYLMALAFGERIGFTAGYIISAAVIVVMVTMYAKAFIGKIRPALIMGVIFAVSYVVNFILLRMEDFALLTGTIILAVILAVLMALTGKMNRQQ